MASGTDDVPLHRTRFSAFEGKTPEQVLQELQDREEIRELIARYAHCVANGVSVAELLTDDGAFIVRTPGNPPKIKRGRAELDAEYAKLEVIAEHPLPMIHNHILEISGDEARGVCSNELRIVENGESIIASGHYEDSFRRVDGRWKFVVRDMHFAHWVPIQKGWAK